MMRRLFWRIFAACWMATVALLVATAWMSSSSFETETIPGFEITRLQAALDHNLSRVARGLRRDGIDKLGPAIRQGDDIGYFRTYVFDENMQEMLGRTVPDEVRRAVVTVRQREPLESDRVRAREVRDASGRILAVATALEGSFMSRLVSRRPGTFWTSIAVGALISALVSALLAFYVAAPLQRVRSQARRFAQGDLDARVGQLRFGRTTEMTALAHEFDHMAERVKALVDSHRRLVRDVSHELRSPLARLRVALELARDGDAAQVVASLDRIELESDRLEAMLAQSLELSRLETAELEPVQIIALDDLLHEVVTNAGYEAGPRQRAIVIERSEPIAMQGWPEPLYSALENIIRNAVTYTTQGTEVSVRLQRGDDGQSAVIKVRDHGPGVPEDELESIFTPFYRTDGARTRSSGGTGLGLAIAQRAIIRHGGNVVASNHAGGGLLVRVTLPLRQTTPE